MQSGPPCVWSHTVSTFICWQHLRRCATFWKLLPPLWEPPPNHWPCPGPRETEKKKSHMRHTFQDWTKWPPKKTHLVGAACYSNPQPDGQARLMYVEVSVWGILLEGLVHWPLAPLWICSRLPSTQAAPDCSEEMIHPSTVCAPKGVDYYGLEWKKSIFPIEQLLLVTAGAL